jgi:hypothetical protein
MSRLTAFLLGVAAGAAALFAMENFYLVRSNESFHVIPKVASKLEIPYRDIRNYAVEDWRNDPSLAMALIKSKNEELAVGTDLQNMHSQLEEFVRSFGAN